MTIRLRLYLKNRFSYFYTPQVIANTSLLNIYFHSYETLYLRNTYFFMKIGKINYQIKTIQFKLYHDVYTKHINLVKMN